MSKLLDEIHEAITWVENEYGFVTDVLRKCAKMVEKMGGETDIRGGRPN